MIINHLQVFFSCLVKLFIPLSPQPYEISQFCSIQRFFFVFQVSLAYTRSEKFRSTVDSINSYIEAHGKLFEYESHIFRRFFWNNLCSFELTEIIDRCNEINGWIMESIFSYK